jgi:hypothetical protein
LENEVDFSVFVQENFKSKSTTEREALALAIGFNPQLDSKFKLKQLEKAGKTQDLIIKRAALAGIGFSTLQDKKGGNRQKKALKKSVDDPLATTRVTSAIALGINAFFSNNKKFQKKSYNEFRKQIKKVDFFIKQGYAIGLGLLAKLSETQKGSLTAIKEAYNPAEMGSPDSYLVGLTLTAINVEKAEDAFDFILETVTPALSNKESRRIAVICTAFLLPLIPDPTTRVEKLEKMIKRGIEYHSKFGTDSALVLTYFSLQDKKQKENLLIRLLGLKDLDPDYDQIFTILKKSNKAIDIIKSLLQCNTLDIKAAGIAASFFLETEEFQAELDTFIEEGLQQRGSGYFDRFLVLLRAFSFILMRKDYERASVFESFFHSNDQRIKRFAGISYACLKAKKREFQDVYDKLTSELDEHVRWGLLVGVSIYESIGHNLFDDELIIGLLLLCLGFIDVSSLLLLSQAMIFKFYQEE